MNNTDLPQIRCSHWEYEMRSLSQQSKMWWVILAKQVKWELPETSSWASSFLTVGATFVAMFVQRFQSSV